MIQDIKYFSLEELLEELKRRFEANKHPMKKYEVALTPNQHVRLSRARTKAKKMGVEFNDHEWVRENIK